MSGSVTDNVKVASKHRFHFFFGCALTE